MNWSVASSERPAAFKLFRQRLKLYFEVRGIDGPDQVPHLLLAVGDEGLRRFNAWRLTGAQKRDPNFIQDRFEIELQHTQNYRIRRLQLDSDEFLPQRSESLDDYVNRCKAVALLCQYPETELHEKLTGMVIRHMGTQYPEFQKEMIQKPYGFTIEDTLTLGRTYEAAAAHTRTIRQLNSSGASVGATSVDAVSTRPRKGRQKNDCRYCGRDHAYNRNECPAQNSTCDICKSVGHWATKCPSQQSRTSDAKDEIFAQLDIMTPNRPGTHHMKVKVDSGARGNLLPLRSFRRIHPELIDAEGYPRRGSLKKSNVRLAAFGGTTIPNCGTLQIKCRSHEGRWHDVTFYVVDAQGPILLGCSSSLELDLISINPSINEVQTSPDKSTLSKKTTPIRGIDDVKRQYPECFKGIGKLPGTCHITLREDADPVVHPPRKYPIHLREEIKSELDAMEEAGVSPLTGCRR